MRGVLRWTLRNLLWCVEKIFLSILFAVGIFGGLLTCLRLGWHLGRRRLQAIGESGHAGLGALEGAVFGLMGLLIAFTFTGSATRFYERRDLITRQTNAIGTAWLRLDLLAESDRERVRDGFRRYLDTLLDVTRYIKAEEELTARLAALQQEIWAGLIQAVKTDRSLPLAQTVLPSVNEMFDLSTSRLMASRQHPPLAVFVMLGMVVLLSGLLAGFGMAKAGRQSPLHLFGFAAITALSIYLILDMEFPRLGLIRIDSFDRALVELRTTMN